MRAPPKVHKRHRRYDKPVCGMQSALLTSVDAEVTCKACRASLPAEEAVEESAQGKAATHD